MFTRSIGKRRKRSTQVRARKLAKIKNRNFESSGSWLPVDNWREQTSHTLSVPHKMISESPACLNCPNGVRGSFAGPLVKSTYVKLTGNALLVEVQPLTHRKSASRKLTTTAYRIRRYCHRSVSASYPQENAECAGSRTIRPLFRFRGIGNVK